MPDDRPRFLLGHGHRLTEDVSVRRKVEEAEPPYSFEMAKDRVAPMVARAVAELRALPPEACPDDYAVGRITIHPQYTAKSFFPGKLLQAVRVEAIGSRPTTVIPDRVRKGIKERTPKPRETVELFVSGKRSDLLAWSVGLPYWNEADSGASQLFEVEQFQAAIGPEKVLPIRSDAEELPLEIILHTGGQLGADDILDAFFGYARRIGVKPDMRRRFDVGGLSFFPLRSPRALVQRLSQFSFLRAVRELPTLRPLTPLTRTFRSPKTIVCEDLPTQPVDPQLRVAVFDGGLPANSPFGPLATLHNPQGIRAPVTAFTTHGMQVTSALLFGQIPDDGKLPQPYAHVDHYRVLDQDSPRDPYELYDVLARIRDVLQSKTRRYAFVNISLGPDLPIEDHEVHPWTAVIDSLLTSGETLAAVAVGNKGEEDWDSGNARVQVPSDSVNSLSVGSCTTLDDEWERAGYSCIGWGRSPGRIKPDVVAFGGTEDDPFMVLDETGRRAVPTVGTSFASPLALRQAVGIRAHFGDMLSPLAIKALMIHCAEFQTSLERQHVGWGRVPTSLDEFVVCPDGVVRVVYQDELTPAQWMRARIPLPAAMPDARIEIAATFCIASSTDPQDPSNYTRCGLDITFRPHSQRRPTEGGAHPTSASFFRKSEYDSERSLRENAHKWETVLHAKKSFNTSSLNDPVFDVHYQTRVAGKATNAVGPIKYALIVTAKCKKIKDLYDRVVTRYRTLLEPLRPTVEIPIRVR